MALNVYVVFIVRLANKQASVFIAQYNTVHIGVKSVKLLSRPLCRSVRKSCRTYIQSMWVGTSIANWCSAGGARNNFQN